jgi:hypothetical protein
VARSTFGLAVGLSDWALPAVEIAPTPTHLCPVPARFCFIDLSQGFDLPPSSVERISVLDWIYDNGGNVGEAVNLGPPV